LTNDQNSASEMTYIVSGGASNSTHSLDHRLQITCMMQHTRQCCSPVAFFTLMKKSLYPMASASANITKYLWVSSHKLAWLASEWHAPLLNDGRMIYTAPLLR